jgi:antitoxin component YwqK of YwqJK toxin-antitoxin module
MSCSQQQETSGKIEVIENYNDQKELIEKGFLKDGKKVGAWTTFHTGKDAGRIHTIKNYIDDKVYGTSLTFSNRGQLTHEANYVNDVLNGRSAKYQWGVTIEEMEYKDGLLTGEYKQYYQNNRKLQKLAHYKEGKLHGKYEYYSEDGKKVMDYLYKDGEKVSGDMIE